MGEQAITHAAHLNAAAAQLCHESVGERGAVDGAEVPVAGLVVAGDHPGGQAAINDGLQHFGTVGRITDGTGGHRAHLVDVGVPAVARKEPAHPGGTCDCLVGDRGTWARALGEPHHLADFVNESEGPVGQGVLEHHESERVRSEVDHRESHIARDARCGARYPRSHVHRPAQTARSGRVG